MHILWISDSPDTPSGFGMVTREVCEGLAARGHQVCILGWQTRVTFDWKGCRVLPAGVDPMGGDALFSYLIRHRPDAVIALADVWWLPYFTAPHVRRQMELIDTPWILYFPIDGDTQEGRLPPSWIDLLREVDIPVAMSRFGQQVARNCGVDCEYIPHGVDCAVFSHPADREEAKRQVKASGKFLVLSDSRNQPRKMLHRLLDVFAAFSAGRSDVLLHLHTDPEDEFARSEFYSYDLRADVRHLGLEGKVRFTPGFSMKQGCGLPVSTLAGYYQAADVHILASSGEGFGLPTLQAAAAGAVPLASAYSASLELVEGHGQALKISDWCETEFGIRRALIDIQDSADKLALYYNDRDLLLSHSQEASRFARDYEWQHVINQWDQLLNLVGSRSSRITRPPYRRTEQVELVLPVRPAGWASGTHRFFQANCIENSVEQSLPSLPGVSVKVKMVQREAGRLEASIFADAQGRHTDVRVPAVPLPCTITRVEIPRRPGYLCVAPQDLEVFQALKQIFPLLRSWVPIQNSLAGRAQPEGVELVELNCAEEARYKLAQSVLLLNSSGSLAHEELLVDAALFGVLCIGTAIHPVQKILWPELIAETASQTLILARALLTNPASLRRSAAQARSECQRIYSPSEEQVVASLRRLHAAEWTQPARPAAAGR